jgi:flavin reductase (DIM6/NTAB) family NADH-FMN oxidoreductase RutF
MADGGAVTQMGFAPTPDNASAFRQALGRFGTGVTVVTIDGPNGPMGFTANSFSSLSMDPPLVMWALARSAARFAFYADARHFAIHVLAADQIGLVERFMRAGQGFDGLDYELNAQKVPLLSGAVARFECDLHATHEGGDHLIVVGRVARFVFSDGAPLVFAKGQMGRFAAAV